MNCKEQTVVKVVENQILEDIKQKEVIDFGLARISLREATKENREGFLKRLLYFVLQTKTFKSTEKVSKDVKVKTIFVTQCT